MSFGDGLRGKITERFWGKIVTTQVKKPLAAVTGRPTRNQTRTGAVFLRRFSDGVNFYVVDH